VLDFGLLLFINSSFVPLDLSYIAMPGIFLYLLMVFQGPSAIVHALVFFDFFYLVVSSLDLSWFLIFWAAVSCVMYFCFIRLESFYREHLAFPASYFCTNLISQSVACFMYLLQTPVWLIHIHHFVFWCTWSVRKVSSHI